MAKLSRLTSFFTKDVGMSSGEAAQYITGLKGVVNKNNEQSFIDHLKQKHSQGLLRGEHSDNTLSDSLRGALSTTNSNGIGLGDRIYNASSYNQKYKNIEGLKQRLEAVRQRQEALLQERVRRRDAEAIGQKQQKQLKDARTNFRRQESAKYAADHAAKREQIQKSLETGSGKSVQESANSAAAADTSGGPVDMTIDRAMLRQKMGGDKTTWGRKDAEEYLLNNVTKKLEDQQLAIAQNKKLTSEQRLSEWNKHKKEAEDILAEGPGFGDYFFGNKLHYGIGGAAFAAAVGSQAFGGHKSNAELYSSPF